MDGMEKRHAKMRGGWKMEIGSFMFHVGGDKCWTVLLTCMPKQSDVNC